MNKEDGFTFTVMFSTPYRMSSEVDVHNRKSSVTSMHEFTHEVEELAQEILEYSLVRLKKDPPLDGPRTFEDLYAEVGNTITEKGLGGHATLELFKNVLATACISTDHPRNLAFIPSAPSEYANLFDLVVGASALYGG